MSGFASLLHDSRLSNGSFITKKRTDSIDDTIQITLKKQKGQETQKIGFNSKDDKELAKLFDTAINIIFTKGSIEQLPRSVQYFQTISKRFSSDKSFMLNIYSKIESRFKNVVLPGIQEDLMNDKEHALDIFNKAFSQWKRTLNLLRLLLLPLDNTSKLKIPLDKTGRSFSIRAPRQLVNVGLFYFTEALVNSSYPKEGVARMTLFDHNESRNRNIIITSYVDSLEIFLTRQLYEDNEYKVKVEPTILVLKHFVKNISDIVQSQKNIVESNRLHFLEITEMAINYLLKDRVLSQYLEQAQFTFFTSMVKLIESITEITPFKSSYQDTVEAFIIRDSTALGCKTIRRLIEDVNDEVAFEQFETILNIHFSSNRNGEFISVFGIAFGEKVEDLFVKDAQLSKRKGSDQFKLIYELSELIKFLDASRFETLRKDILLEMKQLLLKSLVKAVNINQEYPEKVCDKLLKCFEKNIIKATRDAPNNDDHLFSSEVRSLINVSRLVPNYKETFLKKYHVSLVKRLLRCHYLDLEYESLLETENRVLHYLQSTYGVHELDRTKFVLEDALLANGKQLTGFLNDFILTRGYLEMMPKIPRKPTLLALNGDLWPKPPSDEPVKLIPEFQELLDYYVKHLTKPDSGMKNYHWVNSFQRVTIDMFDDNGEPYVTVNANIYQATILMAFEETDVLKFSQLLEFTGMNEPFLRENVNTLTNKKYKLLIDKGNDSISLNKLFKSKKEIVLPTTAGTIDQANLQPKKTSLRDKQEILSSRLLCFIVREMKSTGQMTHDALVEKIIEYLSINKLELLVSKGKANAYIKGLIETLINDDIISRAGNSYQYVP